ncbi:MAG: A24 family peptidase [Lachnospiraceae bacterium]|nr:A24 family peptidase [Lachnospiraceae bacterium]
MDLFFVRNLFLCVLLFLVSDSDLKSYKIPNQYILGIIGNWMIPYLLCCFCFNGGFFLPWEHVISAVLISGLVLIVAVAFDWFLKKKSLGGGDIKLIFAVSLYLGTEGSLLMVLISCMGGLILAFQGGKPFQQGKIPFGPAITFSTVLLLIFFWNPI